MIERLIVLERPRPAFRIGILGPIGVGKSTLSRELCARLEICQVEEDYPDNPFLANFYKNRWEFSYKSQTWFSLQKFTQLRDLDCESGLIDPDEEMDAIYAETLFRMGFMDQREWTLYQRQRAVLKEIYEIPRSDIFISIDAPTRLLKKRISERGRPYELTMLEKFPGYLDVLRGTIRDWIKRQPKGTPIIKVDTGKHDICCDKKHIDFVEGAVINLLLQKVSK